MNNEDMSDIFDKLNNIAGQNNISPDMVNNLFTMFNNSNNSNNQNTNTNSSDNSSNQDYNNSTNNQNNPFGSSGIDFETIMKMKTIIDKMNTKDDPRSNLLQSLKPYLKDSRKSKIDQYIQLMNMSKVMDVFPFMGGDIKK
ncbi:MAG: hypothetical protein IJE59_00065 [Clostridia bacterium]|nr:hypothetical protein [Clostridia bacterium]